MSDNEASLNEEKSAVALDNIVVLRGAPKFIPVKVVLTGLSKTEHQANSPVSTRLATYSLQHKPAED